MAFLVPRPGCGAARCRAGADLPRSLLERILGRPSPLQRGITSREHYAALYAQPGAMHAGFNQFAAFDQDARDNQALAGKGKLTMRVLAVGGEQSFGPTMAVVRRTAATNVQELV